MKNKSLLIILLILVGAFSRIIPHPDNFTAIGNPTYPNPIIANLICLFILIIIDNNFYTSLQI